MAPHETAHEGSETSPAELAAFTCVAPPAFLDALVKQRAAAVLQCRRAELSEGRAPFSPPARPAAQRLGTVETCAYALGLLAQGAQLADGVARLIWRAIAG